MARLQLEHLVKQYGRADEPAVHDLSLDVEDGEFVCLLGPSGCGKTTTLRMIGGFLKPDAGEDRKSTRLNSSHQIISYAVFCLKKKKKCRRRGYPHYTL